MGAATPSTCEQTSVTERIYEKKRDILTLVHLLTKFNDFVAAIRNNVAIIGALRVFR